MLRLAKKLGALLLDYAPFVAMLYLYFFYQDGSIELKFTAIFLACNYYFARTLYLSMQREQRRSLQRQ